MTQHNKKMPKVESRTNNLNYWILVISFIVTLAIIAFLTMIDKKEGEGINFTFEDVRHCGLEGDSFLCWIYEKETLAEDFWSYKILAQDKHLVFKTNDKRHKR